MAVFLIILIGIISLGCLDPVSAQSAVHVVAVSDGGEFNFAGDGDNTEWDIDLTGWDEANTNVTNSWGVRSNVRYEDIDNGTIFMKVSHKMSDDGFWYFKWLHEDINGNGNYTKALPGGHSVQINNSGNITGYIDYRVHDHKAVFLMDTRHSNADLTVVVHNGHLLENATVELIGGPQQVKWTDENGVAKLTPTHGKYGILIEAEGFNSMLIEDLFFENNKLYMIQANMTDCLSSVGTPYCAPGTDDLIMWYKNKDPAMNDISPQGFVNFFAGKLTKCMAGRDNTAVGTLERMSTKWGIYPNPELGVLLYDCDFEKLRCDDTWCEWKITYEVRNFQDKPYNYTVTLIVDGTQTELNTGILDVTFATTGKETITKTVIVNCDNTDLGCESKMYLSVVSNQVE